MCPRATDSILASQQSSRGHAGAPLTAQHPFPAAGHSASYQGRQLPLSFKAPEPLQVTHSLTNSSWVTSAHMFLKDNLKDITVNLQTWDRGEKEHACPACSTLKRCTRQMGLVSCCALPATSPLTAVPPTATHTGTERARGCSAHTSMPRRRKASKHLL